jgi:uncharacterized protein (DUF1778 family)
MKTTRPTLERKSRVINLVSNDSDFELLTLAAEQKKISRSEFIRQAFRARAARVLAGVVDNGHEPVEASS